MRISTERVNCISEQRRQVNPTAAALSGSAESLSDTVIKWVMSKANRCRWTRGGSSLDGVTGAVHCFRSSTWRYTVHRSRLMLYFCLRWCSVRVAAP